MKKGTLIAQGRTAEIFLWGNDKVLKLFRSGIPKNIVENEFEASSIIYRYGMSIPRAFEMINLEERSGIIFEKVNGKSMLKVISTKPWTIKHEAQRLAAIHHVMHKKSIPGLPSQKLRLENSIRQTDMLSNEKKDIIINILNDLPEGSALCHGDFHPDNILLHPGNVVVLDWMTATIGNPIADVARTSLLLRDAAISPGTPFLLKGILNVIRSRIHADYIKTYISLSGITLEQIREWELPIAAARLAEWIPKSEKEHLIKLLDASIQGSVAQKDRG